MNTNQFKEATIGNQREQNVLERYLPLFLGGFVFAVYIRTMAPGIYWGDGIELATVCATGGIAHPTGYPLFTIAGWIFSHLFGGNPALGTNLMCAFFGAAGAAFFYLALKSALRILPGEYFLRSGYRTILAASVALFFSFSRTMWFHSTITEVYSLHILFTCVLFYFFFQYMLKSGKGYFPGFFLIWGLSFSNHMLSLILFPLAASMIVTRLKKGGGIKSIVPAVLLFFAGLLPYLYLPLRAASRPELNWGDPSNLENFIWVISGGEFKKHQFLMERPGVPFTLSTFSFHAFNRFREFALWIAGEGSFLSPYATGMKKLLFSLFALSGAFGAGILLNKKKPLAIAIISMLFLGFCMIFLYNIPDIEAYFLSLYPALLILILIGAIHILHLLEKALFSRKINYLHLLILFLPILAVKGNYSPQDKSGNTDAMTYGLRILRHCPENAMIITFGDNDIYTLWYLQKALQLRPDLTIVGSNFIHNGWYSRYFEDKLPGKPEITIRGTETPPSRGDFFLDLMLWVIEPNIDRFPVLLTSMDPLLIEMYDVKSLGNTLDRSMYERAPWSYLPDPGLFRIYRRESKKEPKE